MPQIPVVDLFAGAGGLGEGFSAFIHEGRNPFNIKLSIEANQEAHKTLQLRAFFRQFNHDEIPIEYYQVLAGEISVDDLYGKYPAQYAKAGQSAWKVTLGNVDSHVLHSRIHEAVGDKDQWVLIGGPPCQAYSVIGRSRKGGLHKNDPKVHLYREYLKILAVHKPPVFVMENVKGLLSSKLENRCIFDLIRKDLENPTSALGAIELKGYKGTGDSYHLKPLTADAGKTILEGISDNKPSDFIVKSELHGIPQARHRVIIVGIRSDIDIRTLRPLKNRPLIPAKMVLGDLPRLRSGLSRGQDNPASWLACINKLKGHAALRELKASGHNDVAEKIRTRLDEINLPRLDRGGEYLEYDNQPEYNPGNWFRDKKLKVLCNYSTREHMPSDLHRYIFASCFAEIVGRSPELSDFPVSLLPNHDNVSDALGGGNFADRFRVQAKTRPSTTITSHIAKDGHYYIHYDPTQCRSLTVREAARLQTFPDNFFFCGARTDQYTQVGNAVPPLLARQIAERVHEFLMQT